MIKISKVQNNNIFSKCKTLDLKIKKLRVNYLNNHNIKKVILNLIKKLIRKIMITLNI